MIARAAVAALLLAAAPAQADALQDQVLAGMRRGGTADVAFSATTRIVRTGAAASEIVTRYDPATRRWTVVRVDGRAPTAKETTQIVKAASSSPLPSHARLAEWFGAPATRVGQAGDSVTYRFAQLPAGTVKIGKRDMSADTVAEAIVNTHGGTPFVERLRFTSTKGFRMMLVAKVDRFALTSTYARLPDGRPFPVVSQVDMSGAIMGKSGTFATSTRYGDLRATR